jgi:hypothetical protein
MGKLAVFLLPIILIGCEQTFDSIIDSALDNYQVVSVSHNKSVDLKNPGDSLLTIRIRFTRESQLRQVFFDVVASDNSVINPAPVEMFDISDNLFSTQFNLKREYPNGQYTINFSVNGLDGENKFVATSNFAFNNGQDNIAPVISNLVIPDTINRVQSFVFSIEVFDENGLNDIESGFFSLFRPDSTPAGGNPFQMHDDGNIEVFGDTVAGDGIYSFKNSFAVDAQTGNWRFVFQAKDRSDSLSNIIEHLMTVQ